LTFKIVKLTWQQKDNFKGVFRHFLNIFQTQVLKVLKKEIENAIFIFFIFFEYTIKPTRLK